MILSVSSFVQLLLVFRQLQRAWLSQLYGFQATRGTLQSCPDFLATFKYLAPNKQLFCLRFCFKSMKDYYKGIAVETARWMLISNPSRSCVLTVLLSTSI